MVKKLLLWTGVMFVVFFIAFRPESAAETLRPIGDGIGAVVSGLKEFITSLVG